MAYSAKDFIRNPLSLKASVIWNLLWTAVIILAFIGALILWAVTPANAQEKEFTGPVAEGHWVVPPTALTVCPAFLEPGQVDPNFCVNITDNWGPYPDEAMCNRRIDQMAQDFPVIAFQMSGIPHWSMVAGGCERNDAGIDA